MTLAKGGRNNWLSKLDDSILSLPRTLSLFDELDQNTNIRYDLPPRASLPGKILKHIYGVLDRYINKFWPMIYKIGATHSPVFRYSNQLYGYKWERVRWDGMMVCFCSAESTAVAFAEAAAIQRHKGSWSQLSSIILCVLFMYIYYACAISKSF